MARKKQQQPEIRPFNPNAASERAEREDKILERVGYRKVKIEDLERQALERQADEFLRNADREAIHAILENVQALRDGMESLKLPSNDPAYLERLQNSVRLRDEIAEKLTQVDIVPDGAKHYLGVGSFNPGQARALAEMLARHFEMTIFVHPSQ